MVLPARLDMRVIKGKARLRSPAHRAWVSSHRCCVGGCDGMPIECAHVRRAANAGTGFKPSDAFTVSLCRDHHRESHLGEKTFEARHGLDLMALAREFFARSPHRSKLDDPHA